MIALTIICDGCHDEWPDKRIYGHGSGNFMRERAGREGWTSFQYSGKDYCPACSRRAAVSGKGRCQESQP